MASENFHIPVLSHEAVRLVINPNISRHILVDGTLGGGGYTKLLCERAGEEDRIISIDKDIHALEHAGKILGGYSGKLSLVKGNFGNVREILRELGIGKITGLVLDLGLSSYQLEAEDGFSFMRDTTLDMRADKDEEVTAADVLNTYTDAMLESIFEKYGDIGNPGRLSDAIVKFRKSGKFETTFDLVGLVKEEYSIGRKNLNDFLAKIFQSLRIEVNRELMNLENALSDAKEILETGGRIVVVSYHSLEDRIVKNFFRDNSRTVKENKFRAGNTQPVLKVLTKMPVIPDSDEVRQNIRSRSARLRAAEKI